MKLPNMSAGATRSTSGGLSTLIAVASSNSLTGTAGIQPQQSCRFCTGVVRGFREEQQYFSCYSRCRAGGGHHWGCRQTCCCEVTGCYSCIFA